MLKTLIILSLLFGSLLQAPTPLPPAGGLGQGPQPTSGQPTPTAAGCEIKAGCGVDAPNTQNGATPWIYVGGGLAATLVAGGGIWMAISRRKNVPKSELDLEENED